MVSFPRLTSRRAFLPWGKGVTYGSIGSDATAKAEAFGSGTVQSRQPTEEEMTMTANALFAEVAALSGDPARAMARAYGVFATDGHELDLRAETSVALAAPSVPPSRGFFDECRKGDMEYSLGFMKTCPSFPFGHPRPTARRAPVARLATPIPRPGSAM